MKVEDYIKLGSEAYGMLGMAVKAGKVKFGSFATECTIKSASAKLVVRDEGLSDASNKKFENMCNHHKVQLASVSAGELERICGKSGCMILAVTDEGFAKSIPAKSMKNAVV